MAWLQTMSLKWAWLQVHTKSVSHQKWYQYTPFLGAYQVFSFLEAMEFHQECEDERD